MMELAAKYFGKGPSRAQGSSDSKEQGLCQASLVPGWQEDTRLHHPADMDLHQESAGFRAPF